MEKFKAVSEVLAFFSIQLGMFFAGLFGAFVSTSKKELRMWERITSILSGGFIANYLTPMFLSVMNFNDETGYGMAFIVGYLGMTAVEWSIDFIHNRFKK
jgi:hypothetical protein